MDGTFPNGCLSEEKSEITEVPSEGDRKGHEKKKRVGGAVLEALLGGIIIAENQEGATAASSSAWRGSGRCVI